MSEFIKGVEENNTDKIQLEGITVTPTLEKVTDAAQESFTANVTNNNGAANVELLLKLFNSNSSSEGEFVVKTTTFNNLKKVIETYILKGYMACHLYLVDDNNFVLCHLSYGVTSELVFTGNYVVYDFTTENEVGVITRTYTIRIGTDGTASAYSYTNEVMYGKSEGSSKFDKMTTFRLDSSDIKSQVDAYIVTFVKLPYSLEE